MGCWVFAGDTLEKSWLHVSSSINCGKMKALEQLLCAWHAAGDNKVLSCHAAPPPLSSSCLLGRA